MTLADLHDAPHLLPRRGADSDDDLVEPSGPGKLAEIVNVTQHRFPVNAQPDLSGIVVEEADHLVTQPAAVADLAEDLLAHLAGAHDDNLSRPRPG